MPFFENIDTLFIHIPRTGGTHIEEKLNLNCLNKWPQPNMDKLFGFYRFNDKQCFVLQHLTYQEIMSHDFLKIESKNIKKIFAVIRNPYDRCISLYNWYGGNKKFETFDIYLTFLESLNLDNYSHDGIIVDDNIELNIDNIFQNIKYLKYFFAPQYKYICDEKDSLVVDIFKYEDEIQRLSNYLGIDYDKIKLSHKLIVRRRQYNAKLYNTNQLNRIRNIYKKDFEILNYSQDIYNYINEWGYPHLREVFKEKLKEWDQKFLFSVLRRLYRFAKSNGR